MSYEPTNWKKGDKITSVKLNKIENGIQGNDSEISDLKEDLNIVKSAVTMPSESVDATKVTNTNIAENGDKWNAVSGYDVQYVPCVSGKKVTFTITPNRTGQFRFGFSTAVPINQASATYLGKLDLTGTTAGSFEYTPQADGYVGFGYYNNLLNVLEAVVGGDALADVVGELQAEIDDFDVETDKTLTVSDKPADAKVTGDRIRVCEEWIHGEAQTATPTDVSNVNLATNATKYIASNGFTTSYIPIRAFEKWTFTAVTVRSATLRYGFTKAIPANQVPTTWLYSSDRTGAVTDEYTYTPTEDGYFTVSYYYNVLSSLTASGYDGGAEKDIKDNSADIDALESVVAPINTDADFRRTETYHSVSHLVDNARYIRRTASRAFTLVHFSDIHADTSAYQRILADVAKLDGVNDIICSGDMVLTDAEEIASWWDENVLTCIGNHDSASFVGGVWDYTALPMADRDAYYIAPFEDNWGITHTSGTSYYYKDYTTQKIRLIVLDSQLYQVDGTEKTAQQTWLEGLLASAITNNLHVIIVIHGASNASPIVDCSFSMYGGTTTGANTMSYTPTEVVNAVESAIGNGLKFVCYLCGHKHEDYVYKATDNQLGFIITCANSLIESQWNYGDQYRSETADAYNIVCVDTVNTLVKVIRGGGADVDNKMRTRKGICFNYSTVTKVGEIL